MTTTNEIIKLHNGNGAEAEVALAASPYDQRRALMPSDYQEAFGMARAFAASGMFGVRTPEQAVVILMTGMEMGLPPATAMRGISVIQNKPSPDASTLLAVCLSHPGLCKYFAPVHSDAQSATYKTHRAGSPEPIEWTFDMAMARRAGLEKKENWVKHPEAMLRARCIAHLARMVYPDLTLGLYIPDEAEDIPAAPQERPPRPALGTHPDDRAAQMGVSTDRDPAPGPASPSPERQAPPACGSCGKALTKAQQDLSIRRCGEALCPACQKAKATPQAEGNPEEAPASVPAEDPLRRERREKVARLAALLSHFPPAYRKALSDECLERYGTADVKMLDFAVLDDLSLRVEAELKMDAEQEDAEPDPFATEPGLLTVPATGPEKKGHGDT